jgi:hypothetical protein
MSQGVATHTFPVSDVTSATEPLDELAYHQAVTDFLCGPVESCSKYHGRLVANVVSHPLIAAIHGAFTQHRPLCLSPDIIWLTITQGLAIHINQNSERLRHRFVSHQHKLKIIVRRNDFVKGSPENPWPEVFSEFSAAIRDHIGESYDLIVADFSTTGPVERAASEVVLLDAMQAYFEYELHTVCGIPSITLEGTVDDWQSIARRVEQFREFDLDWWVGPLQPILQQFVDVIAGRVDHDFWDSIYKYRGPKGSGSPHLTGWIVTLFPYLTKHTQQYVRNTWLTSTSSHTGPTRDDFPNLPSKAPFKWKIGLPFFETTYDMEFIGGLIGVSQNPDTLCLRPEIGWVIRDVAQLEQDSAERTPVWERANPFSIL